MTDAATRAQRYLACLSDPSRFRLLLTLGAGERCVTELANAVGLSQSCTTRHLQALERAAAVESVRQGKRVVYRIRGGPEASHPVLRWALAAASDVEGDVTWRAPGSFEGDGSPLPGAGPRPADLDRTVRPRRSRAPRAAARRRAPGAADVGGAELHRDASIDGAAPWVHAESRTASDLPDRNSIDAAEHQPSGETREAPPAPIIRRDLDDFLL